MGKTLEERFWEKVDKSSDCWEWHAAISNGYGRFNVGNGKTRLAHRVAYTLSKGSIPDNLVIDHLCRNRKCVNPNHLEAVSQKENLQRGETIPAEHSIKTHCPQGHEYSEENTYLYKGSKYCKKCRNFYVNRRYHEKKKVNI